MPYKTVKEFPSSPSYFTNQKGKKKTESDESRFLEEEKLNLRIFILLCLMYKMKIIIFA